MTEAETDERREERSFTSLATLRAHQRDIRRQLKDGFTDRVELLLWQHDVAAKSIGEIGDDWHAKFVTDRWLTAAMLADAGRRAAVTPHPPSERVARRRRMDVVQHDLMPAMRGAIRQFRQFAVEYTDDVEDPVKMGRQRFIAMRPRLDEVVREQRIALEWALGRAEEQPAIRDRESALEWADQVVYATYGNIGEGFSASVTALSSEWLPALRNTDGISLKVLLATDVLPAMNETIRYVVQKSQEVPAEVRDREPVDPRPTEAY